MQKRRKSSSTKEQKKHIIAEGYIDFYMCSRKDCLGLGVISKNGEEYKHPKKAYEEIKGTKGKLIWVEQKKGR